ncbi:MAG: pimeloyl-ACP methyl ester esterase BioH [Burkholderiales bacterium]|nr:pimeloyl-ACP methyl ester esterase BioH [Burkholderiales bacterium]
MSGRSPTAVPAVPAAPADLFVATTGTGPPLVLLHGFALHGGLFAAIADEFAGTHRVHVVDLPGHGYSPPGASTLDGAVTAVARVISRLDAPAQVLGWSLGGIVAQRLALDHPHLLDRLVLVGATPRFVTAPGWPAAMSPVTLARFGEELRTAYRPTLQRFLTLQVQGGDGGVDRAALATLRAALFARPPPTAPALAAALAVLTDTDLRAEVVRIGSPTLVVTGSRDALTPAAAGAWLAERIPGARLAPIAGAAHAPFLSHPAAFFAAVQGFLADVHAAEPHA